MDTELAARALNLPTGEIALKPVNCEYTESSKATSIGVFEYCVLTVTNNAIYLTKRNDPNYLYWWWQNQYQREYENNKQLTQFNTIPLAELTSIAVSESPNHKHQLQFVRNDKQGEKVMTFNFYYKSPNEQDEPQAAQNLLAFLQNHTQAKLKTDATYVAHYVARYQPNTYYPVNNVQYPHHHHKHHHSAQAQTFTPPQLQFPTTPNLTPYQTQMFTSPNFAPLPKF